MRQLFRKNALGLVAASALLASCGPLISFGDEGPADEIYTLRYQGSYPASGSGPVVFIDEPAVADSLKGDKVAVALPGNRRSTIDGVRWSAPLADLIRDYVLRSLAASSEARMVGDGGLDIQSSCRLGLKVWEMDFVPGARAADDKVSVVLEFTLVRLKDNQLLGMPTIAKQVSTRGSGTDAVMAAFHEAMGDAAGDAASWFGKAHEACDAG
ncbi:ABC-type transport auxiliary lipoprotein family protein [Kordiimonas lipolytica]|uniref:ABC-type transport auxiliary lipoprotein family protein n=1 Tax=Kordiimonas lipolytica TaxID=1662421 RepID=A0ABV8UCC3_9PROT|nr:ABC-type transport auxiliary lipoprotein family protein [Kordiimonas lipolytica]